MTAIPDEARDNESTENPEESSAAPNRSEVSRIEAAIEGARNMVEAPGHLARSVGANLPDNRPENKEPAEGSRDTSS